MTIPAPSQNHMQQIGSGKGYATPSTIFSPVFGLLGLGLAWRRGVVVLDLPSSFAEILLAAATLLYLFCVIAYSANVLRCPTRLGEDLKTLAGRAGLAVGSLSIFLLAMIAVPYSRSLAIALLLVGLALHTAFALIVIYILRIGQPEGRQPTPAWHVTFVGFIVAATPAAALDMTGLARGLFVAMVPLAVAIWVLSARQLRRATLPPSLRPLLAMHLAPVALFAIVAAATGLQVFATRFAVLTLALLTSLLIAGPWLTATGFSPLWSAFTFPLAASASALLVQDGRKIFEIAGLGVLIAGSIQEQCCASGALKAPSYQS
jgi:tellurite resistance protein